MARVDLTKCKLHGATQGGSDKVQVRYARNARGNWRPVFLRKDGAAFLISENEFTNPERNPMSAGAMRGMGMDAEDRFEQIEGGEEPDSNQRLQEMARELESQG